MLFVSIMLLIFLVVLILIIWVLIKRKLPRKKICKIASIIFLIISCVFFSFFLYSKMSSRLIYTKTTDLSEERIGELRLFENIDDKEFKNKYMINAQKIDNTLFDYYKLNNGLVIAINKNRQIIRIEIDDKSDTSMNTSKGIGRGSSVDEVIKTYGENYYKRMDDIGVPVIGYEDKQRKVKLEFFNYQHKITMIRYDISSMQ